MDGQLYSSVNQKAYRLPELPLIQKVLSDIRDQRTCIRYGFVNEMAFELGLDRWVGFGSEKSIYWGKEQEERGHSNKGNSGCSGY